MFAYPRQYRGKLKAVVFDSAGTTVDYGSCAPAGVFIDAFKRFGLAVTPAQAREPMGLPKRDHVQALLRMDDVGRQWQAKHGRPWTEADVDEIYRVFIPMQLECLPRFSDPIPGVVETAGRLRHRGLKIAATTGYNREMMEVVVREAAKRGFSPDVSFSASDVPAGRPAPWMCLKAAESLGVYPMEAVVKIGDTIPDVEEGLNAGMWTIGIAKTGNELGLIEAEVAKLPEAELARRLERIKTRMLLAGAHYVADGVSDCEPILDEIETRLARGEKP